MNYFDNPIYVYNFKMKNIVQDNFYILLIVSIINTTYY